MGYRMSAWTGKPGIVVLIARLREFTLRLERLTLQKRLDRTKALLAARKGVNG